MNIIEAKQILWISWSGEITEKEIKDSYKRLAIKNHPDKWWDAEIMKSVNIAMDVLDEYIKKWNKDIYNIFWEWSDNSFVEYFYDKADFYDIITNTLNHYKINNRKDLFDKYFDLLRKYKLNKIAEWQEEEITINDIFVHICNVSAFITKNYKNELEDEYIKYIYDNYAWINYIFNFLNKDFNISFDEMMRFKNNYPQSVLLNFKSKYIKW